MAKQSDSENRPVGSLRRRLTRLYARLHDRAATAAKRFSRQTEEVLSGEPIDFSAPSIPYYENLASRLSFVRVVLYMVLLVFVVVAVASNRTLITYDNLYFLVRDINASNQTAQSEVDYVNYPVSSGEADFAVYRGGLVIAGCEVVTALSGSGRQTLSVNVAYASPVVRASDKYILTFGRGEQSFAVYNAFVQVHREETDFPVYDAAMADNGTFAIVTRSRDYTSEVKIYNSDMKLLAADHIGGYVTGLSIAPDGSALGIVSSEAENGVWTTRIKLIRFGSGITEKSLERTGAFGYACGFVADDRLAIVLDDRLLVLKNDASIAGEVFLAGRNPTLAAFGEGRVAILSPSASDLGEDILTVYDRNAREDYTLTIGETHPISTAGGATALTVGRRALYIRAGDTLFAITGAGRRLDSAPISRDTLAILVRDGDELYICTPAYAQRMEEADLTEVSIP